MTNMADKNSELPILFFAEKIHVHRWPMDSPVWNNSIKEQVDLNLNKNLEKKKLTIDDGQITVDNYCFKKIKKVGITVPLFKKQMTMVFEGNFEGFDAHVHVTTKSSNYLETFNKLMVWNKNNFHDSS